MTHFAYPYVMLGLLVLPLWWFWRQKKQKHRPQLPLSTGPWLNELHSSQGFWQRLVPYTDLVYTLILVCTLLALARPQQTRASWPVWGKGIDIAMVLDTSSSMLQTDLKPNRMQVAKQRLLQFVQFRRQRNDRIGLVLFAKRAFTLCPLTEDHAMVRQMLRHVQTGVIADDTALGDALATALARLRHSKRRQRAILLVTDGENNAGRVHPVTAAQLARKMNIPIFPLLIGKDSTFTAQTSSKAHRTPWGVLQHVASISRGSAYHATDLKSFQTALLRILDQMTPMRAQKPKTYAVHKERFTLFLYPGLVLLALLLLLELTRLRQIP